MRFSTIGFSRTVAAMLVGASLVCAAPATKADVFVSVRLAPPVLPVYVQPVIPGPGYMWQPGYWAYGPAGYYWVPGTWVLPPSPGLLWTPGYWGWNDGVYMWHVGYWGPHVGFYGGVNYGFGYAGLGFVGGFWQGGVFSYNRAVTNVNVNVVHNTYTKTVVNNVTVNNVSYNGGSGGVTAQPNAQEQAAAHEAHVAPTQEQMRHEHAASTNHALLASVNHGRPAAAATAHPATFQGRGVTAARAEAAPVHPQQHPAQHHPNPNQEHPRERAEEPH